MTYLRLFHLLTLNHFKNHYIKVILSVVGMATGIAIFVTTSIYKDTIYKDVRDKEQLIIQSDKWIVKSGNGRISAGTVKKISGLNLFHDIAPKSSRLEYIDHDGEKLLARIVGIDILSRNGERYSSDMFTKFIQQDKIPVAASSYFKRDENITFTNSLYKRELVVIDNIKNSPEKSPVIVTDISFYQSFFSDTGWVDQLEVNPYERIPSIRKALKDINPYLHLISQEKEISNKQSVSDAFLVNLRFFSLISLVISVLLIYQFYRFLLMDREKDFARLRAVGISKAQLRSLLFTEIFTLGLLSSFIGILGGYLFSIYSLHIVTSTVSTFYFNVSTESVHMGKSIVITSVVIGVTGCLIAGVHPVIKLLGSSDPVKFLRHKINDDAGNSYVLPLIAGLILLGVLFTFINTSSSVPKVVAGVLSVLIFTLGASLILPFVVKIVTSYIVGSGYFPVLRIKTAASYIDRTVIRQTIFILSLSVLLGFVISLIIFISSFRGTIKNWIYQVTPAEMYIQSELNDLKKPYPLDNELLNFVKQHPLVKEYDTITRYDYEYKNTPVQVRASDFEILKGKDRLKFKSLAGEPEKISKTRVFVSEPFEKRFGKTTGDTLTIVGDTKTSTLVIQGVFYDYVTERGAIYIDRELGKELFSKDHVNGISVYGISEQQRLELERDIKIKFNDISPDIENQEQIRENTLSLFDRTFRIVWLLAGLAVIIAVVTIFNATIMVYLERFYELMQLRSLGASYRQLVSVVWSQMSLLSIYTVVTAFLLSAGFLNILVILNEVFFGWTIDLYIDWKPYFVSILTLFGLSWIAVRFTFNRYKYKMDQYRPFDE